MVEGSAIGGAERALDHAIFQDHNSLLEAKMMMKYGDAEDKARALLLLRQFSKRGKENRHADSTATEAVPIPFTIPETVPSPM